MMLAIMLQFATVYVSPPPHGYDHVYHGRLSVIKTDAVTVRAICRRPAMGCSVVSRGRCLVVIDAAATNLRREVYRHELAHCNGWPANHPR